MICDGKSLAFPVWRESEPLKQATRQAKWLSDWLTTAVGEPIRAKPILILLGWFIKRTGIQEIPVLSGREYATICWEGARSSCPAHRFTEFATSSIGAVETLRLRRISLDRFTFETDAHRREIAPPFFYSLCLRERRVADGASSMT